jgi:hypothetical protein
MMSVRSAQLTGLHDAKEVLGPGSLLSGSGEFMVNACPLLLFGGA